MGCRPGLNGTVEASLAGTALIQSSTGRLPEDSVALAFQMRAMPKLALQTKVRDLNESEVEVDQSSEPLVRQASIVRSAILTETGPIDHFSRKRKAIPVDTRRPLCQ